MRDGRRVRHRTQPEAPGSLRLRTFGACVKDLWSLRDALQPVEERSGKARRLLAETARGALDCTTRAICFVSRDGYASVRERQNRVAREIGTRWNNSRTLDRILKDCGYVSFRIEPKVTRKRIVEILKDIANPIVTASYRHVAPSLHNMIFDTFQSENGRCHHIFVHRDDERKVRAAFKRVRS